MSYKCYRCTRHFGSKQARYQHMDDKNHFAWDCGVCDLTLPNEELRDEHEHDQHRFCGQCQRHFMNHNNLNMHLNSKAHRADSIDCPFCKRGFTTAAGVAHHLETGSCPALPGKSRDDIYRAVRAKDPSGIISKKLIGWQGSSRYESTGRAWNGSGWECYFCDREFRTQPGLDQHLNSPVHQAKLYHCPNRACRKEFVSLAATINHLESESCGYARFERVQQGFSNVFRSDRLIGF